MNPYIEVVFESEHVCTFIKQLTTSLDAKLKDFSKEHYIYGNKIEYTILLT